MLIVHTSADAGHLRTSELTPANEAKRDSFDTEPAPSVTRSCSPFSMLNPIPFQTADGFPLLRFRYEALTTTPNQATKELAKHVASTSSPSASGILAAMFGNKAWRMGIISCRGWNFIFANKFYLLSLLKFDSFANKFDLLCCFAWLFVSSNLGQLNPRFQQQNQPALFCRVLRCIYAVLGNKLNTIFLFMTSKRHWKVSLTAGLANHTTFESMVSLFHVMWFSHGNLLQTVEIGWLENIWRKMMPINDALIPPFFSKLPPSDRQYRS